MKRFVFLTAIASLMLFLVACGSDSVEFENIAIDPGLSSDFQFSCVYKAVASAEPSLLSDGSLFTVIRDEEDWQEIWNYALEDGRRYPSGGCPNEGEPPPFGVDFQQEMVLVLLEQQPSTGYSLEIDRIVKTNGEWVVEATRTTPCCGVRGAFTYPHHVVSMPLFGGDLDFIISEIVSPTPGPKS